MENATLQADSLISAFRHSRPHRHQPIVIKLGGSAMENPDALCSTLEDVAFLHAFGMRPILVHGGGKPIDRAMAASGLVPKKIQGRRYTDDDTLRIVVEVLTREICTGIVKQLQDFGIQAQPMYGEQQVLFGEQLTLPNTEHPGGEPIDLGHVGEVTRVDADRLRQIVSLAVPVIPSVAFREGSRHWLNVNADTAACGVAAAIPASKLIMVTDTPGILRDPQQESSVIERIDSVGCANLIAERVIDGGMLPKVEACFAALKAGVGQVRIVDGRRRHSLLLDLLTASGVGTEMIL